MILAPQDQIAAFTAQGWWGTDTLDDIFTRNVRSAPERIAVIDPPNRADIVGGNPRRLTYAALDDEVNCFATALLNRGLVKDDVIAVQLANTIELVAVYLAAWRLGIIVSPLPVQWRAHELADVVDFVGAKVFVTARHIRGYDHAEMLANLRPRLPALRHVIIVDEDALPAAAHARLADYRKDHPIDANEATTICWTSGTEARPKGVPRSHNHWLVAGVACGNAAGIQTGDAILMPFPLINMAAIGGILMPWLMCGGTLALHHPFDLAVFLRQLVEEKIAYTVAPPAILTMLLKEEKLLESLDLSALKCLGSGSAALSPWMVKTWQEKYCVPVANIFGSNEGTCLISGAADVPDPEARALLSAFRRQGHGVARAYRELD